MERDPACIFCKIIAVEVPAVVVYEDPALISFLDINPLAEGHLLVVPRAHHARLHDMPAVLSAEIGELLPLLTRALLRCTGAPAVNLLCSDGSEAGQVVPHVHFHLIPRRSEDGLGLRWNAGTLDAKRAESFASSFRSALSRES